MNRVQCRARPSGLRTWLAAHAPRRSFGFGWSRAAARGGSAFGVAVRPHEQLRRAKLVRESAAFIAVHSPTLGMTKAKSGCSGNSGGFAMCLSAVRRYRLSPRSPPSAVSDDRSPAHISFGPIRLVPYGAALGAELRRSEMLGRWRRQRPRRDESCQCSSLPMACPGNARTKTDSESWSTFQWM